MSLRVSEFALPCPAWFIEERKIYTMISNYSPKAPSLGPYGSAADVNDALSAASSAVVVQSATVVQAIGTYATVAASAASPAFVHHFAEMVNNTNDEPKYENEYGNDNDNDNGEDFLSETEFALLNHATTVVGNFDPFSTEVITKRPNFIPVLEGRGGIDKDEQGHRRDTLPIANAIDQLNSTSKKTHTAVFQFLEENDGLSTHAVMSNDALKKYLKRVAHGIIVRINPGTLSALSQKKCDDMLRELSAAGVVILSHPDVSSSLGAKDVRFEFWSMQ